MACPMLGAHRWLRVELTVGSFVGQGTYADGGQVEASSQGTYADGGQVEASRWREGRCRPCGGSCLGGSRNNKLAKLADVARAE